MRLSRRAHVLLRFGVGITLAFIYIPLLVVAIYAFNGGKSIEWPLTSVTTHWFSATGSKSTQRNSQLPVQPSGIRIASRGYEPRSRCGLWPPKRWSPVSRHADSPKA